MSLIKIPDSLLKKFQCAPCGGYLSMAPIGIGKTHGNVCGHCWIPSLIRNKPYEELAALHLFPCRYRTKGCLQYVSFNKATDHEIKCGFRTYNCPFNAYCSCNWQGFASQICHHSKKIHPAVYLEKPFHEIYLDQDYECYYLTQVDGVVLLLQTKYCTKKKKIWLNAVCIDGVEDESSVSYKIKISDKEGKRTTEFEDRHPLSILHMQMVSSECIEIESTGLLTVLQCPPSIYCTWTIEFQKKDLPLQNSSKCPNCNISLIPPIYRCPLSHITCSDCKGYNEKCGECNEVSLEFTRAIDLENIAFASKFVCRWRNCQKILSCDQLREHEQECQARIYRCPECNQTIGCSNQISNHFNTEHAQVPIEILNEDSCKLPIKPTIIYMFVHKEIFKIITVLDATSMWTVHIEYFGFPSLDNYFRYEIKDCCNFLYYVSKSCNNRYKATQATCGTKILSECFLEVKFYNQGAINNWIPLDCPQKRIRLSSKSSPRYVN